MYNRNNQSSFQKILWIFPFICFIGGYQLLSHLYMVETFQAPSVIGIPIQDAFALLSSHTLNPKLITTKEDADLPDGTILSQTPAPGTKVKSNQSVFLVTSKKPNSLHAPNFFNQTIQEIQKKAEEADIRLHVHYQKTAHYPKDSCIAQFPTPGTVLDEKKTILVYVAQPQQKLVLLPNFKNMAVPNVKELLDQHGINLRITHTYENDNDHICNEHCMVIDQRPLAGSFIILDQKKPLTLHIKVQNSPYLD